MLKIWTRNLNRKKKEKIFRENCFENVVSKIHKNYQFCPNNLPKIGNAFMLIFFFQFFSFCIFFKIVLWTHQLFFIFDKSETTFSKQFSPTFQFCFVIYTLKCIELCVNGVTKCVTAQVRNLHTFDQYYTLSLIVYLIHLVTDPLSKNLQNSFLFVCVIIL